ncbi:MAG: FAD-dependent oxidoreductase [Pseudomonadota bacterium]
MSETFDVCVIGAGISGASFAYRCACEGASVVVLEKEASPGGCIKSYRHNDGLVSELGTRTLTNRYRTMIELLEDMAADDLIEPLGKSSFKLSTGNGEASIMSHLSIPLAALSMPKTLWTSSEGKSLEEHYGNILGKGNYNRLLRYAFSAVLSQPADQFPTELLFKKRERDKTRPKQFTLKGGNLTLVESLLGHRNLELKPSFNAASITRTPNGFSVLGKDRKEIRAKSLAIAVTPEAATALSAEIDPDLSAYISELRSSHIHSVHVSIPKNDAEDNIDANLIGIDKPFFSVIYSPGKSDDFYTFHFDGSKKPDDTAIRTTVADTLHRPIENINFITSRNSSLPRLSTDNLPIIEKIENQLRSSDIYLPCNYIQGLSIEDCCIQSKQEYSRWADRRKSSSSATAA